MKITLRIAELMDDLFEVVCKRFKIKEVKDFQKLCLINLRNNKDMLVSYPTGSGKSLCYEAFGMMCDYYPCTCYTSIIVIEPLLSIMDEQVTKLRSLGFLATYIGREHAEDDDIVDGKFQYLFSSPEQLLGLGRWREMLLTETYQTRRVLLVVDEAHTVVEW
jgi:ATP-dependent DNA helicase RecQ